jgi:PAS domain S-box-containing protein
MVEFFEPKAPLRGWRLHLLPAAVLAAVVAVEIATPDIRVTPSLMTIALACLSLVLPPRALAAWSTAFFLPVLAALIFLPVNGAPESPMVIALRCTAYIFVAVMAYAISRHRVTGERQFNNLLGLFDSLGTPIVVSDEDGEINFANRACCKMLGRSPEDVRGMSFFALFAHPEHQGKAIEHYLELLSSESGTGVEVTLTVRGVGQETVLSALCSVFQIDRRRLLVSQLLDSPA